jgi:hypothetical protein
MSVGYCFLALAEFPGDVLILCAGISAIECSLKVLYCQSSND